MSEQILVGVLFAVVLASVAYCLWPRPSFKRRWLRSRDQLLTQAAGFGFIKHANQLSMILWILEDIALLGDQGIKKALSVESGKLNKHVWGQLLARPKKLKLLLDKIEAQGFIDLRELELTEFLKATGMYWKKINGGKNHESAHSERMREVGAEQRASWQCGLRNFAVAVEHDYESRALALTLSWRKVSALAAFQGNATQPVDVNSLIQIEGRLYRVTQAYCLRFQDRPSELVYELYCFATGSTHYLSAPDSPSPEELYLSTHLGCCLAEFDDPPDRTGLGEIKEVAPGGLVIERQYTLVSDERAWLYSVRLKAEGRLARWLSDEFRISALWLYDRRVTWHESRISSDRSAINVVLG